MVKRMKAPDGLDPRHPGSDPLKEYHSRAHATPHDVWERSSVIGLEDFLDDAFECRPLS
jgi:hypothetical protein